MQPHCDLGFIRTKSSNGGGGGGHYQSFFKSYMYKYNGYNGGIWKLFTGLGPLVKTSVLGFQKNGLIERTVKHFNFVLFSIDSSVENT